MTKYVLAGALLFGATMAGASSPGAWDQMNQRVNRACVAMSGLSRPQLLAQKISFSDTIGVEVRQLRGVDKRGRMSYLLCAYDRRTGRTEVQPAGGWLGATVKP
jgi:hypothetical protein